MHHKCPRLPPLRLPAVPSSSSIPPLHTLRPGQPLWPWAVPLMSIFSWSSASSNIWIIENEIRICSWVWHHHQWWPHWMNHTLFLLFCLKGGKWFHYNNQTQPRWSDVLCCWFAGRESSGRSGLRHRTVSSWQGSWTHVSHSLTTERHVCFKSHGNHLRRSKSRKRSHSQITPMQFCFYSNDHNSRRFIL